MIIEQKPISSLESLIKIERIALSDTYNGWNVCKTFLLLRAEKESETHERRQGQEI